MQKNWNFLLSFFCLLRLFHELVRIKSPVIKMSHFLIFFELMSFLVIWLTIIFFCLLYFGNVIVNNVANIVIHIVINYRKAQSSCFDFLLLEAFLSFLLFWILILS